MVALGGAVGPGLQSGLRGPSAIAERPSSVAAPAIPLRVVGQVGSPEAPQDEFISSEDRRWWNLPGDLMGGLGDRLALPGLSEAASTARTPSSVARALGVVWNLVANPGAFLKRLGGVMNNPIGTVSGLVDDVGAVVNGVGSLFRLGGKAARGAQRTATEVKAHGLVGGLKTLSSQAKAKARQEAAMVAKDLHEGVGVGARPFLKQLAKSGQGAAEQAAKRAMLGELGHLAPEAFGRPGLLARITGPFGRLAGRASDLAWALRGRADRLAEGLAGWLGRSKAGGGFLRLMDRLNPLARVAEGTAQRTLAEASAKGLEAASKATATAMAKQGVKLGASEAARLAATGEKAAAEAVARVGTKASGKGISRFLPALNLAMAAYDTFHAVQVWRDPKASGWRKGWATATALCSWAAASNLPVLSQVGAVGAVVSSVLEGLQPERIAGWAKGLASGVRRGAKALWKGLFG